MLRMAGVPALAGGKTRWHAGIAQRLILAVLGLALLSILILGGKGRPARMAAQSATEVRVLPCARCAAISVNPAAMEADPLCDHV